MGKQPASTLRVLLVDENRGRSALLEQALNDAGYSVIAKIDTSDDLAAQVREHQPDVIIVDLESPDRDTLEHMHSISRDQPRPIVMFAEDEDSKTIHKAIKAGVSAYIVDGLSSHRVKPVMEVAITRFREYQALRDELTQAKVSLEERKLIDRAKALLIKRQKITEQEAHQAIRKLAMDRGLKLADAARNIISVMDLLD
ncbi:MAG: ANTAR domain-containing protein [Pseudomonadota bacterium]|nr:ANTAR domain-containing protein [Pseudomonadota bacterium]